MSSPADADKRAATSGCTSCVRTDPTRITAATVSPARRLA
jgi:hypothetical protein